ncbi:MAG: sialate O-acetylesterase [Kiritimatiellia bacterium]|jgi:sialate O-acetylesterase
MRSSFTIGNAYGDHMVLQRNKPVRIVGEATPGFFIDGEFRGVRLRAMAGTDGRWTLEFPAGPEGGPFTLSVTCQNSAPVVFQDVLVGDVWYASGQSNMEFFVVCADFFYSLRDGREVAAAANDDGLRLYQVPHGVDPVAPCDLAPMGGSWKPATSADAVGDFSAVAYWFGAFLREKLGGKVPIGMINGSWGGTLIEPWIPASAYASAGRTRELEQVAALSNPAEEIGCAEGEAVLDFQKRIDADRRAALEAWLRDKYFSTNPGRTAEALRDWARPDFDDSAWVSNPRERLSGLHQVGVVWYRIAFDLPAEYAGRELRFHADSINDCDEVFLDGVKIGATGIDVPQYWMQPRDYPAGVPGPGRHVLALRVQNHYGWGAVAGRISLSCPGSGPAFDLAGLPWKECVEFHVDPQWAGIRPPAPGSDDNGWGSCQTPTALYNAMVHPFTSANLCGVIWYQGCSNAGDPEGYKALQALQIEAWRRAWRDPAMPFLITQLSAFQEHRPEFRLPDRFWEAEAPDSNPGYAPFRQMQEGFLDYPGVGVACTIDIGDHSDIHPPNKKEVGRRLAHEAMRVCYGDASAIPGPRFREVRREGAKLRLVLDNVGDGLEVRGGVFGPHLFAVAGEDGAFAWAEASLEPDNTVLVWSDAVREPVRMQYAYTACPPEANLSRKGDGLPVFPFQTK